MRASIATPEKKPRRFLSENLNLNAWQEIEPYFKNLLERQITTIHELEDWLADRSELDSVLSENMAWRYIRMTCDTTDENALKEYQFFVQQIQPQVAPLANKLNEKVLATPGLEELPKDGYPIMLRSMRKAIEIFREENIPLMTELQTEAQKFGQISGAMTIEHAGEELTMQQASVHLQSTDRQLRESVYVKISERRLQDRESLDALFSRLIELRDQVARNADYANFRDYMFAAMGRFDYTPEACFDFHDAVEAVVVPMLDGLTQKRQSALDIDTLRPWDKYVDPLSRPALKPFSGGNDLVEKTIECFSRLDPFLGDCMRIMRELGHLDLESRKGKAPGGYNYPLAETGIPFIFMNATSTLRDMVTILHEGGHAVHSFLTRDLRLYDFKSTTPEVAELASMTMELLSMDHWDVYFENPQDLARAKKEHLEQIIETLPWVATIDKFQHWLYEHAGHSSADRRDAWNEIFDRFSDSITNWSGLERQRDFLWQKQLHLFEVPFYYIEYGMAQLGAVAIWKNYRENVEVGLKGYLSALKLGYTKTIPEIYQAAGIKFDFSAGYIRDLMQFVRDELEAIEG